MTGGLLIAACDNMRTKLANDVGDEVIYESIFVLILSIIILDVID